MDSYEDRRKFAIGRLRVLFGMKNPSEDAINYYLKLEDEGKDIVGMAIELMHANTKRGMTADGYEAWEMPDGTILLEPTDEEIEDRVERSRRSHE